MDTLADTWTPVEQNLFRMLATRSGEALSQREIALALNVSPTAIAKAIPRLGNLITVKKTKTINFVTLNRDNKKAIELKRVANLKNIYVSGLNDILETTFAGATIILFGSYAKGEDIVNSDIDIAIIGRTKNNLKLDTFEKLFFRKINIQCYKTLSDVHIHLRSNICNGIVLSGSIEL